jgi:aspartate/methionine/tyrosine aminotransferase
LRAAITPRTRAIITVSPNNPSGAVYPEATLRAVNALCAEHGLWHISDEAYEAFTYEGAIHFSPGSISGSDAHTISLYSMSKTYGFASWRVGWMVFPQKLASALRKIQDTLIICPPVISQFAALGALTTDAAYLRGHLRDLTAVRAIVRRALTALETAGIAEIPVAQGAFYFLLRLRAGQTPLTSLEIATRLIREHGVAVIPGSAFGLNQGGHLRVAYGALSSESATEGIGRLVRGLRAIAD